MSLTSIPQILFNSSLTISHSLLGVALEAPTLLEQPTAYVYPQHTIAQVTSSSSPCITTKGDWPRITVPKTTKNLKGLLSTAWEILSCPHNPKLHIYFLLVIIKSASMVSDYRTACFLC